MFKNADPVTLTDSSGKRMDGTLHLPDLVLYSAHGVQRKPQQTSGGYGVHTILTDSGSLFRTEGRLAPSKLPA